LRRRCVTLKREIADEARRVYVGDAARIRQVLANLLGTR
jgi:hypothetical protein